MLIFDIFEPWLLYYLELPQNCETVKGQHSLSCYSIGPDEQHFYA